MKAITYEKYGGPEVLKVSELRKPVCKDDQILINVKAAEATKADCEMRSFNFSVKWFWLPLRLAVGAFKPRIRVLGGYFSGVVEAVGANVTDFSPGDEVYGGTGLGFGSYGEYIVLPQRAPIAPKPENMSFVEAAAVPLGGLNGLHFMKLARLQAGDEVLINGAGGVIGAHAVQIAKYMGAVVTGVDGGHKEEFVRSIGATHFIDYSQEDFTQSDASYDVIFDMVPGSDYGACLARLKPNGCYLSGNPRLSSMLRTWFTNRFSNKRASFRFAKETKADLLELKQMIEAGEVQPIVDKVLPMQEAATAHELVETEQRIGAIVIDHTL